MTEGIEEDEVWNVTELLWQCSLNCTAIRLVDLSSLRTRGCRRMDEVFQDRLVVESGVLRRRAQVVDRWFEGNAVGVGSLMKAVHLRQ